VIAAVADVGGAASARTVPLAAMLAAAVRKRRRDVASAWWLWDMGEFVGGVLCTLSALGMGIILD
jgi:hypothetical protein